MSHMDTQIGDSGRCRGKLSLKLNVWNASTIIYQYHESSQGGEARHKNRYAQAGTTYLTGVHHWQDNLVPGTVSADHERDADFVLSLPHGIYYFQIVV